jgi:outer membrane protein OmpA-like peptidoglycan-associated protein
MADLDVQPKKKGSILPWILLGLGIIALLFFLARGCNNDATTDGVNTDSSTSAVPDASSGNMAATTPANTGSDWSDVDFNSPSMAYDEITNKDINVRGNNNYGIYDLGENILFDEGKATIKSQAEQNLKQIAASIEKRYTGGNVRIFGHTDASGSAGANKELAEQRAEAVRNWLVKNGAIADTRISLHPIGESQPVASNATDKGREQNRRVEIVARGQQ